MRPVRFAFVIAFSLVCIAVPCRAQNNIDASRRNAIVRAVQKVAPAVVTVNVLAIQYERTVNPFMDDFFGSFGFLAPRYQVREKPVRAIGSGFIFDNDGHILTNYHVVQRADYVSVTLPDGRTSDVEYVGADERSDLAVLRLKGDNLPLAMLGDSDDLLIGEWMIALGNPFGQLVTDPHPTVSVGVVSAKDRRVSHEVGGGERFYQDLIQTDAAINPGNSGGPLVNSLGQVVGVNTFIFSQSGGSVGLGFAIPINRAKRVAEEIVKFGHRRSTWPGFTAVVTDDGPIVYEILKDCPAYAAGLRPGDRIVAIDGRPVTHPTEINFAFWGLFVGDTTEVQAQRLGEDLTFRFEIEEIDPSR
jgi:serine protease Do